MTKIKYQGKHTETRLDHTGKHHLVNAQSEYQEDTEAVTDKVMYKAPTPSWVRRILEKFRDKPAFQYSYSIIPREFQEKLKESVLAYTRYLQNLEMKIKDGFARNQTAERVKEAKTKIEKRQILEEFHKEPMVVRKQTALKLNCMREIREMRKRAAGYRNMLSAASDPVKSPKPARGTSVARAGGGKPAAARPARRARKVSEER